jgi:hypothetical protein
MEGLIELVVASFARHGVECPTTDSHLVWGQPPPAFPAERIAELTLAATLPKHNFRKGSQADPAP